MMQPIVENKSHDAPRDYWHRWFDGAETERFREAIQHIALCDLSAQPHCYGVEWLGWGEGGIELRLPTEMMPANGQPVAYLAFWDRADRQLRVEGPIRQLEHTARGGRICLTPHTVEFWQGARFRLHDRVAYRQQADQGWKAFRLYP